MNRLRNSFRRKRKKREDDYDDTYPPCYRNEFNRETQSEDHYNLLYYRRKQSIKNLIQSSETLLKKMKKKRKQEQELSLVDFDGLQRSMENVKQCFESLHGRLPFTTDESCGFNKEAQSGNRSHDQQVEVHRRDWECNSRDPVADYNLSVRGRQPERRSNEGHRFQRSYSVDESSKKSARRLQEELKVREQANESLQEQIKQLKEDLARNKRELDQEIKLREDTQNRLSELMGRQLKTNNPAITDLSDPDRPLNLVDKFCNIYDNEWTDLIDEIEQSTHDERTAVKVLLTLVSDAYNECYKLRHHGQFFIGVENGSAAVKRMVREIPEDCKLLLKGMDGLQLQSLRQVLLNRMQSDVSRHTLSCISKKPYVIKCLELCWMMVCHSPPIHLEWKYKGCSFDTSILKPFTEPGSTVEYMVWPVMFLHKNGPLLNKGVAQGCEEKRHTHF